jgi:hypothetical protein
MLKYNIEDGIVGIRIGRGNGSTRRKPAPVPLRLPQIPYDLTQDRTQVGSSSYVNVTMDLRQMILVLFNNAVSYTEAIQNGTK